MDSCISPAELHSYAGPHHYPISGDLETTQLTAFCHRPEDLERALTRFNNLKYDSLSVARKLAIHSIRELLKWDANQMYGKIDWNCEVSRNFIQDLDALFFAGQTGVWGSTHSDRYYPGVPMKLQIMFCTRPHWTWTRVHKRSAIMATLLHEMTHAYFMLSHASVVNPDFCRPCYNQRPHTVGNTGHGPSWWKSGRIIGDKIHDWIPEWRTPDFECSLDPLGIDRERPAETTCSFPAIGWQPPKTYPGEKNSNQGGLKKGGNLML